MGGPIDWRGRAKSILIRMPDADVQEVVIALYTEKMASGKGRVDLDMLAWLGGDKAVPLLKAYVQRYVKTHRPDQNWDTVLKMAKRIGPHVRDELNALMPRRIGEDNYWGIRQKYRELSLVPPAAKHAATLVDMLKYDMKLGCRARDVGLLLSRKGDAPALPLAKLLKSDNWETRWNAAVNLAMIGPNASPALPALQTMLRNEQEEIRLRARAAVTMSAIAGKPAQEYYKQIPGIEDKVVAAARAIYMKAQSHDAWKAHIAKSTSGPGKYEITRLNEFWNPQSNPDAAKLLYDLATGANAKAANRWLRENTLKDLDTRREGERLCEEFLRVFNSENGLFAGRLEPDVEKAFKERLFKNIYNFRVGGWHTKTSAMIDERLAQDKKHVVTMHNLPGRADAGAITQLGCLVDDPAFRNRKLKQGDTIAERHKKYVALWSRGLKDYALHGLFGELGSSEYEHANYWAIYKLLYYSKDPVLAKRARMFLDLALIEAEQIYISGWRGGSKSRAKNGGMGGSGWNTDYAWWMGERARHFKKLPGLTDYAAPETAILLHWLGRPRPVYEIVNRHPNNHELLAPFVNYAYVTPEYITGCAIFDVTNGKETGDGTGGRWSGVNFRNRSGIELPAYTGEKWHVQSKDVLIAQRFKHAYYGGETQVRFTGGFDKAEAGEWVFASTGEAYAAVRIVTGGAYWTQPVRRILKLKDQHSPIIIQTGRKAVYGSFEAFQKAILKAPYTFGTETLVARAIVRKNRDIVGRIEKKVTARKLIYTGPNSATIEWYLHDDPYILPKIDGKRLDLNLKYSYRSPYMTSKVGSDVVTVRYGKRRWDYDFARNTVTEVTE